MALSSAIAVTITLAIIAVFGVIVYNVTQFTENVEEGVRIGIQVDWDYDTPAQESVIRRELNAIDGVANIEFYTKDEEYQYYLDSMPEDVAEYFSVFEGEESPMHDAFYVEVENGKILESVANQIKQIPGVYKVDYGGNTAVSMVSAMTMIRRIGITLALSLVVLAIALIANTIKITIQARSDEIDIMRSVGATNGFIRSPFVIEGIVIGALGAVIPMAATAYGYHYIYNATGGMLISNMFKLVKPMPFVLAVCGILLGIGMFVGLVGSYISVTRFLRFKR